MSIEAAEREFIGGPLDGERRFVPADRWILYAYQNESPLKHYACCPIHPPQITTYLLDSDGKFKANNPA